MLSTRVRVPDGAEQDGTWQTFFRKDLLGKSTSTYVKTIFFIEKLFVLAGAFNEQTPQTSNEAGKVNLWLGYAGAGSRVHKKIGSFRVGAS